MRRRACVPIIVLALLLAACQSAGTRPIIKIGLSAPFTGQDESVGYSVIGGVRLAIRERNLAGGVAGYSVELVALDDANLPDVTTQRARELIIDPAVMGVLGGFDGPAAQAAAVEYTAAGMPFVTLSAAEDVGGAETFHLTASQTAAGQSAAAFADRTLEARTVVVVSDETAGSVASAAAFSARAQGNGVAVSQVSIARWQLDFAGAIAQIGNASPEVVYFAGRALEAGELLKQMRAAGVTATFLGGPAVDDARFGQIAGAAAGGAYYVSLGFALPQVADAAVRENVAKAGLRPAGAYTVQAYDGTQLLLNALAQAIKAHGKPARQAVAAAVHGIVYEGLSGRIVFDDHGNRRDAAVNVVVAGSTYPGTIVSGP